MAKKDDETGITPSATDGVPNGDGTESLEEARRRLRDQRDEEAVGAKRGNAIDDQSDEDEDSDDTLFPMGSIPGDHAVTMKNIVQGGKPRKVEAKMRATPIAMRDGLIRYGEHVELVVTVEAGKVEEVPDLEEPEAGGRRRLVGVKDVQHFRPVHVASAVGMFTTEQVLDILESEFGIPRSADKIAEVFGPVTAEQRAAAASG